MTLIILELTSITSISDAALGPLKVSEQQFELDPPVPHWYSQFRLGSTPRQPKLHSGCVDLKMITTFFERMKTVSRINECTCVSTKQSTLD